MTTSKEEPRIVRLSREDDGREVWLDTATGQQLLGVVERDDEGCSPHIAVAARALRELRYFPNVVSEYHVCTRVLARHAAYTVCFQAYKDEPTVVCTCEMPLRVPEADRLRAVDYLNRANWGLRVGAFELDPSDGEVRFRVSADVDDGAISADRIGRMLDAVVPVCDRYCRGLMAVVFGGADPAVAIAEAES